MSDAPGPAEKEPAEGSDATVDEAVAQQTGDGGDGPEGAEEAGPEG